MKTEKTTFKNNQGTALAARLDSPDDNIQGTALFAHCFTCTKNINAVRRIVSRLVENNIAVFSFDFTGLGESGGEFAGSHFSHQAEDIVAAAQFITLHYQLTPTLLVGHSLGGTAALYAARNIDSIKAIATIGAPSDPEHIIHLFTSGLEAVESHDAAEVCISGRPFNINKKFIADFKNHPPSAWLPEVKKEILILHSPVDAVVAIEHAEKLFKALHHPKSYVSLGTADHMLTNKADAEFAASVIAGWATKHFFDADSAPAPAQEVNIIQTDHQAIAVIGSAPFKTDISINNRHALIADEPPTIGGTDTGTTPFGYLLASLGACTVMTLQVYAKRKGINLTRAAVHLDYEGKPSPKITRFLEVEGDFDTTQRERLLQIADLCPIHKLLTTGLSVETKFLHAGSV